MALILPSEDFWLSHSQRGWYFTLELIICFDEAIYFLDKTLKSHQRFTNPINEWGVKNVYGTSNEILAVSWISIHGFGNMGVASFCDKGQLQMCRTSCQTAPTESRYH